MEGTELMADILLDEQSVPTTPSAGQGVIYPDSTSSKLTYKGDDGLARTVGGSLRNFNTADVVATGVDTYLTGSSLAVPSHLLQAGTTFKWRIGFTKSAAGTAAATFVVRVGTGGVVGDTARLTFTLPSSTAAIDAAYVCITAVLRNVGAAGVLAGMLNLNHNTPGTDVAAGAGIAGLSSTPVLQVTSAGFDTTVAGTIIGVSSNPGASGVHTHQVILGEMFNI